MRRIRLWRKRGEFYKPMIYKPTLRELKKEATALALAHAAFELALEKGLDGFVVEDVVQRAGYSRRTFANHYSCKEEAVAMAAFPYHEAEEYTDLLENLPQGITPIDILNRLMRLPITSDTMLRIYRLVQLSKEYRTLEPYILTVIHRLQISFERTLGSLFGEKVPPAYTHLLTGAVCGAILPVIDGTLDVQLPGLPNPEGSRKTSYEEYLDTMFHYLRNGF